MNDPKNQIVEKLRSANNILVTVSTNPSVDQLAACIGLTLVLNKLDKHATAVFSGQVPSTIEFLQPEKTIEKTTDSLRDFIISLDKSKADKLRYKVEDDIVKIFITPYRTSISEKDLVFSQGDFNVDVVLGLGVHRQSDLDAAITNHGRILHDATVICINNSPETELGTINWLDQTASSLSELVANLASSLGDKLLDEQNATALLTGVVAETNHFGNEKTSPRTMTVGAQLLEAGANQKLVADKLSDIIKRPEMPSIQHVESVPGSQAIDIPHSNAPEPIQPIESLLQPAPATLPQPETKGAHFLSQAPTMGTQMSGAAISETDEASIDPLTSDTSPGLLLGNKEVPEPQAPPEPATAPAPAKEPEEAPAENLEPLPPSIESLLPDEYKQEQAAPPKNPQDAVRPEIQPQPPVEEATAQSRAVPTPTPAVETPGQTLADLEKSVHSPHAEAEDNEVDSARKAVEDALKNTSDDAALEPLAALNAQPVNLDLGHNEQSAHGPTVPPIPELDTSSMLEPLPVSVDGQTFDAAAPQTPPTEPSQPNNEPAPLGMSPADQPFTMPLPPSINVPAPDMAPPTSIGTPPQGPPPPPMAPPMMPANFNGQNPNQQS